MLERVNAFIWGEGLVFLLLFTGGLYTIKLGFIQFRAIPYILRSVFGKSQDTNKGLSQWKTVCMSLGTAMGTGNITGVAAALAIGGAGAVFWMWISAFFGMALVYAENVLSVKYSENECRGPMAYISKGLGSKTLSLCFAFFCILASLGMGGMVQVSSFSESFRDFVRINDKLLFIGVFLILLLIISGGAKRIGTAAQCLLPAASLVYAAACIWVILQNSSNLPGAVSRIFIGAFGIKQAAGGISGALLSRSVSVGMRRGIFSNEAGLGSSPLLHSAAESDSFRLQGMWSMFEVFLDTIVCCTLTAVTILCASPDLSVSGAFCGLPGGICKPFISVELMIFAFCTIIGWYYCGEIAFRHIAPSAKTGIFCIIYALTASLGTIFRAETIWTVSDIFNGLMAFPNLVALLLLIKKVEKE